MAVYDTDEQEPTGKYHLIKKYALYGAIAASIYLTVIGTLNSPTPLAAFTFFAVVWSFAFLVWNSRKGIRYLVETEKPLQTWLEKKRLQKADAPTGVAYTELPPPPGFAPDDEFMQPLSKSEKDIFDRIQNNWNN